MYLDEIKIDANFKIIYMLLTLYGKDGEWDVDSHKKMVHCNDLIFYFYFHYSFNYLLFFILDN